MRPANGRVLVACSGGPDSRTLLDALSVLDLELFVASVDHGLRPESAAEAAGVVAAATAFGLSATVLTLAAPRSMAGARQARYQALVAHALQIGAGAIAVGHTATDQAETLLDRMLRGAGLKGLSAMAPVRACGPGLMLLRPMLGVTAKEVEAYVHARPLSVVRDPSNHDRHYRRARLRHDLLPLLRLERADADRALAELAERLRQDSEALDLVAADQLSLLTEGDALDVVGLMALAAGVRARVLQRACPVPLESVHLDAVTRLCEDARGTRSLSLPGGVVAERAYQRLRFGAAAVDPGDVRLVVERSGSGSFLALTVEVPEELLAEGPLVLRNLLPGDRLSSGKKLKELLIDRKLPRSERRRLPLLARATAQGEEVVWMYRVFAGKIGRAPVVSALTQPSAM